MKIYVTSIMVDSQEKACQSDVSTDGGSRKRHADTDWKR